MEFLTEQLNIGAMENIIHILTFFNLELFTYIVLYSILRFLGNRALVRSLDDVMLDAVYFCRSGWAQPTVNVSPQVIGSNCLRNTPVNRGDWPLY